MAVQQTATADEQDVVLAQWIVGVGAAREPRIGLRNRKDADFSVLDASQAAASRAWRNSSAACIEHSWYRLLAQVWPSIPSIAFLRFAPPIGADVFIGGVWAQRTREYDGFAVELTPYLETARRGSGNPLELLVGIYNPADRGKQPNGKARISAISHPGGDTYSSERAVAERLDGGGANGLCVGCSDRNGREICDGCRQCRRRRRDGR